MAPNCVHLSNPYHQCTQACSNKTKTHTNKNKTSGYGRSVTDGQLGKKINDHKRTYSGCPKASNPYHHCDDNCHKRLSDSGAPPPSKIDRKKKLGSKPEPPVLDTVPASKVGAVYLSEASSPISHYSENKKFETEIIEHVSSEPISGQIDNPSVKPVIEELKDVEHVVNPTGTNEKDKIGSHKDVPITHVDDTEEGLTISAGEIESIDYSFSGIIIPPRGNEENDEGETESVGSEPRLQVGRYQIKESLGSILQSILDKYGDIGASCDLESLVLRSYYIECVCFVVQELQSASIMQLSKSKVKELLAILKDAESAQVRVAWLRSALDELAQNIELVDQHQEVDSLREELESELETLARKEQEVADIKTRIPEIRGRLNELELNKSMLSINSKVGDLHVVVKSLVDQLL